MTTKKELSDCKIEIATDSQSSSTTTAAKWDLWRDSPVRYLGYANEVGEAFAPIYKKILLPSYGVAIAYVLGDTFDKTLNAFKAQLVQGTSHDLKMDYSKIAIESLDTFTWQIFASVMIPGLTIKGVAKAAGAFINHPKIGGSITKTGRLYFPTAVGLVTIPYIIKPIDYLVDNLMDSTYRSYFKTKKFDPDFEPHLDEVLNQESIHYS